MPGSLRVEDRTSEMNGNRRKKEGSKVRKEEYYIYIFFSRHALLYPITHSVFYPPPSCVSPYAFRFISAYTPFLGYSYSNTTYVSVSRSSICYKILSAGSFSIISLRTRRRFKCHRDKPVEIVLVRTFLRDVCPHLLTSTSESYL